MTISIVLADDHELVRAGIRLLLERNKGLCVVGEASNGTAAIELVRSMAPDVAVLDLAMPLCNGIEAARIIHKEHPNTAIVIVSMYGDEGHVLDAFSAGALGYVLKTTTGNEFVHAVEAAAAHQLYLSPSLSAKLMHAFNANKSAKAASEQSLHSLSPREREILQRVVEGHSSAAIASELGLASTTVDTYRSRLMAKLHVSNLSELVRFAIRNGLLPLD